MFTVEKIAEQLKAEARGNTKLEISGVASLELADESQLSFLANSKLKDQLDTTLAGCVLLSEKEAQDYPNTCIIVGDPYLAYAKCAQWLDTTPVPSPSISEHAVIHLSAKLGKNVSIAAGCVIEEFAEIGDNVILGPNVTVGLGSTIGSNTRIFANVSIYHGVSIGQNCLIHSGAVLGADGFGFANEKGEWVKIPQLGGVEIGERVEIGANACVDRGALKNTIIGDGVKLDNFCHIAHNVVIGKNVAMAAYAGVAGSTKVGDYSTFSGRSTILGHLDIAAGTHVTACSVINKSNKEAGVFSSGTGMQDNKTWRKNVARFRQLDDMAKQIKHLEKQLKELSEKSPNSD